MKALIAAFGDAGHAFPALALGREMAGRGHEVVIESWERWREPVEALGIRFEAAEEYVVFPPPPPGESPGAGDAALAMVPLLEGFGPDVVVSDILTLAPSLAADLCGVPRVTLIPHLYPVHEAGMPFFGVGMATPRTAFGRRGWRAALPVLEAGLRRGRRELNETRERIGLEPLERFHGGISDRLVIVGTFPQLEYPRQWPDEVVVTGPLEFELPHPEIELPDGEGPLVLVASSTAQDPECELIRRCFEGLAGESVRVVATTNGHRPGKPIDVPANGLLVDWLSYSQVMARQRRRRLPRRPRHPRASAGARQAAADLTVDRRHGRERRAGPLGRRRADRAEPAAQRRDAQVGRPDAARGRSLSATRRGDRGERVVERRGREGGRCR